MDFRRRETEISPLVIGGDCVERGADFRFLGVHTEDKLSWNANTSELVGKGPTETVLPQDAQEREHLTEMVAVLLASCH